MPACCWAISKILLFEWKNENDPHIHKDAVNKGVCVEIHTMLLHLFGDMVTFFFNMSKWMCQENYTK